ncbi:MAG: type II secretion system F family protein [Nocardioidaceae bacterium]|nr:type II secretion system F family protein [Nocardioidaceae bacterium]
MRLLVVVCASAGCVALLMPGPVHTGRWMRAIADGSGSAPVGLEPDPDGLLRRGRWVWALLAGSGAAVLFGGPLAWPIGAGVFGVVAAVAGRLEPSGVRRRREEVRRDLPAVVTLLAATLRSGAAPGEGIDLVCRALPGAASQRLVPIAARLRLGGDPVMIWEALGRDPELGSLGRTLARAHRTGAPVVAAVERLAEDLAGQARAAVEDRARAVGVRAAVPLGLCLLPAFLLLGIVPLAVSLAQTIV